ncbi:MAG: phosphoesterase [Owenweeksia sp.]|nr:phosphoesterase [Owenweeksia sp.]MBF99851.1 phosphoesterase [Owenweeksia sp.]HBF20860.1 phosphoesterase [Cryomorphaceae bacterium]|tara:strand:- start:6889 stop:8124 length:1236 start_codon:yes stop_codon:yes gene_type:complete
MNLSILIRLLIVTVILLIIDLYAYQAVRTAFRESAWARWVYWGISVGVLFFIAYGFFSFSRQDGPGGMFQLLAGTVILFLIPKLILLAIMLGEDVWRLLSGTMRKVVYGSETEFIVDRRKFISQTALVLAAIPFAGILHGIWKGKYNYNVIRKTLGFKDLPPEFDGLTITQISDIHSGSFDNAEKISYGIDLINAQQSDLILFTGDLVNNKADEMDPWIDHFARLEAPMGKFSILGNHDYGDYINWRSSEAKEENMQKLYRTHEKLGFKLLRNEHVKLQKENNSINIVGVENWGDHFVKHGDLDKATHGVGEQDFNILMSHDPSHFDSVVKKFNKWMHLTLSGHTHGMQFGIEIPGLIKWSPVKYRYPKWAGLYEDLGRYLYVNRGFGFLAFPGRVGIWPEITVLTLKRKV